ncbi:hypothetical protein ACSQ67_025692 [Phaseolus vulgaris]
MVMLLHYGTCFNLRSTTEPLVRKAQLLWIHDMFQALSLIWMPKLQILKHSGKCQDKASSFFRRSPSCTESCREEINCVEFIHSKLFLHQDIKPDNFLMGLGRRANQVYAIDFGLAKKYGDSSTHQHIPYRYEDLLAFLKCYSSLKPPRSCSFCFYDLEELIENQYILSVFAKYSNEICDDQTGQSLTMKCDFETLRVAMTHPMSMAMSRFARRKVDSGYRGAILFGI